jgi:hypothetical protein
LERENWKNKLLRGATQSELKDRNPTPGVLNRGAKKRKPSPPEGCVLHPHELFYVDYDFRLSIAKDAHCHPDIAQPFIELASAKAYS